MQTGQSAACAANIEDMAQSNEASVGQFDSRSSPRTNLFVAAVLYSEDGNRPVKVRNLSESGGLVEGSALPPVGTAARLCRGSLAVSANVVWERAGKAGLRFTSAIRVADWLPSNHSRHQSHVDELVNQVRAGRAEIVDPPSLEAQTGSLSTPQQLDAIAFEIERLTDELAADPYVVANHSWKLQQLEGMAQRLRRIIGAARLSL